MRRRHVGVKPALPPGSAAAKVAATRREISARVGPRRRKGGHVGDGQPARQGQRPQRDHLAGVVADDRRAEDAAAAVHDRLDHAGRLALDLGAVVLDERKAQDADAGAVTLPRRRLAEADGGDRRIGEGRRRALRRDRRARAGGRGSSGPLRPPDGGRGRRAPDRRRRRRWHRRGGWRSSGCRSTTMPPASWRMPAAARSRPSTFGLRPAATTRWEPSMAASPPCGSETVKRMPPRRRATETISTPARTRMPSARRRSTTIATSSGSSSGRAGPRSMTVASMPRRL